MYAKVESLNGTVKEIDLSQPGWVFVGGGEQVDDWHTAQRWKQDWLAIRRHCGGLLILRKRYSGTTGITCEELALQQARKWVSIAAAGWVAGFPEMGGTA